jgi:hypothetical protein
LFSEIELLEYHVESITEGVLDPMHNRKQAKYATPLLANTSIVPRMMNPIMVMSRGTTTCRDRSRK